MIFGYEKRFIKELGRTKDPVVFFGVARVLKVNPMVDKDTPKDFAAVLEEVIDAYFAAAPSRQKEVLKILKDANECKENIEDGNYTKDPAETSSNKEV